MNSSNDSTNTLSTTALRSAADGGRWYLPEKAVFVHDLVRDYCAVYQVLTSQRQRFDDDGSISYAVIKDLLGEPMRQGVFRQLKDKSHSLFRGIADADEQPRLELLIDWCVGYAFHECVKLMEDAYLGQHYTARLIQLCGHALPQATFASLCFSTEQTTENSAAELDRILRVLTHGLYLLVQYLADEGDNPYLARWLACNEDVARAVFGIHYDTLVSSLYNDRPGRLYFLAAQNFMQTGQRAPALNLLLRAKQQNLLTDEGLALLLELQTLPQGTSSAC